MYIFIFMKCYIMYNYTYLQICSCYPLLGQFFSEIIINILAYIWLMVLALRISKLVSTCQIMVWYSYNQSWRSRLFIFIVIITLILWSLYTFLLHISLYSYSPQSNSRQRSYFSKFFSYFSATVASLPTKFCSHFNTQLYIHEMLYYL